MLAARGACGRALPDQQRRPRQRAVPAAAPPRPRACASRSAATSAPAPGFSMFKEGLQAYFVQQLLGADGLPLDAGATCSTSHRGGRRGAGARRRGRRPERRASSSTRSGCAAGAAAPSTSGSATPAVPRRRWPRSSRWRRPPTSRASGWTTSWCTRRPRASRTGGRAASCGRGAGISPGRRSPPPCRWQAAGTGARSTPERTGRARRPAERGGDRLLLVRQPRQGLTVSRRGPPLDGPTGEGHAQAHDRPCARSLGGRLQLERRRLRAAGPGLHRPRPRRTCCAASPPTPPTRLVPRPAHHRSRRAGRPLVRRLRHHQRRDRRRRRAGRWSTSTRSSPTRARPSSRSWAGPGRRSTSPTRRPCSTSPATPAARRATSRRS